MARHGRIPAAAALAATAALAGCDPFNTGFRDTEAAVLYRARVVEDAPAPSGRIRVMTYNVKYGGARLRFYWECGGSRTLMTEGEVRTNVAGLAALVRAYRPDVLLVQEIDTWRSKRVAYVDEVQLLLDATGLSWGAYASQWKADWVPTDGQGPVDSGNAVLSRWPIAAAVRHALALETDLSTVERYFYLKRNVLEVRLAVPGLEARPLVVLATHAEAFSDDGTRKKHLDALAALMQARAAEGYRVVAGGDLNEIPPGSRACRDWPEDAACTGGRFEPDVYCGEETWMDPLYAPPFSPDVAPAEFAATQDAWYTFVGDERFPLNRKLDHLFTNGRWLAAAALQTCPLAGFLPAPGAACPAAAPILLSDHVPVVAELEAP